MFSKNCIFADTSVLSARATYVESFLTLAVVIASSGTRSLNRRNWARDIRLLKRRRKAS